MACGIPKRSYEKSEFSGAAGDTDFLNSDESEVKRSFVFGCGNDFYVVKEAVERRFWRLDWLRGTGSRIASTA